MKRIIFYLIALTALLTLISCDTDREKEDTVSADETTDTPYTEIETSSYNTDYYDDYYTYNV